MLEDVSARSLEKPSEGSRSLQGPAIEEVAITGSAGLPSAPAAPGAITLADIIEAREGAFEVVVRGALAEGIAGTMISRNSTEATMRELAAIGRVYMDIDGTAVNEGEVTFSAKTIEAFRRAQESGIELCVGPTGKPVAEAVPLWRSLPEDIRVDVIIEKGAYRLHREANGDMTKKYLLASPEDEQAIAAFRERFYPKIENLELSTLGGILEREFNVVIVPAGSGKHESVVSFDVLKPGSPRDYWTFSNEYRKEVKVADQELLHRVEERFRQLVAESGIEGLEDARIIHLGNGNIELAPKGVEKHLAIERDIALRPGVNIGVAGDSANDQHMLSLSTRREDVHACLILHNERSTSLLAMVDSVVIGQANVAAFLDRIGAAKRYCSTLG